MANLVIPSKQLTYSTTVVPLTTVQSALWKLGMPILDASAVTGYKKRAQREMLWRAVRWQILAAIALVAVIALGRQPGRIAAVAAAATTLTLLFGWLVNTSDLQWASVDYLAYQRLSPVPLHVSSAASALIERGVPQQAIGVEYLKADPVLFVRDTEDGSKRYDLIVW
jgi:hypothetical protein